MAIEFSINGRPVKLEVDPQTTLLDVMRNDIGLNGPKFGCGLAQCGACAVLLDGRVNPFLRNTGQRHRRTIDNDAGGTGDPGKSASVTKRFYQRTGGAVRLLRKRHHHNGGCIVEEKPLSGKTGNQAGTVRPPVPLRCPATNAERDRCGRCRNVRRRVMKTSRREFLTATGGLAVYFALPGCEQHSGNVAHGQATIGNRIEIEAAGTVTLMLGKVELGQGIGTALAQIAAEELGVDFSRMRLAGVDTDHSPDESYTFSTISVQQSGPRVRQAAASGRHFLMQRAAHNLGVPITELSVTDGDILVNGKPSDIDYWALLAGEHHEVASAENNPLVPSEDYRIVGKPVHRLDIPGIVFGEEYFLQDLCLPGMVHARVVRPPAERVQLTDLEHGPAQAMPGVLKIVRDGNFLAVIAEREDQARNAARTLSESATWSLAADLPPSKNLYEWLKAAPASTTRHRQPEIGSGQRFPGKNIQRSLSTALPGTRIDLAVGRRRLVPARQTHRLESRPGDVSTAYRDCSHA